MATRLTSRVFPLATVSSQRLVRMKTRRSHTRHDRRQCESRPKYRASPYLPAGKQMGHLHPRPKKFGGTMNPPGQAENTATTTISWQMEPAMTRTMVDPHRSWPRLLD